MPTQKPDLRNRHLALLLAWMVPGLGHLYQGRTRKGLLYAACILPLFIGGLAMGDWKTLYWRWVNPLSSSESFCFNYLGQFWAGLMALPALIQATLLRYGHAPALWGFMVEPLPELLNGIPTNLTTQHKINGLYQPLGKLVEIGTLYTTVAGLLNILAMYDAYEGPALPLEEQAAAEATQARTLEAGATK